MSSAPASVTLLPFEWHHAQATLSWNNDRIAMALFAHIASPQVRLTKDPNTFFFFLDHLNRESPFARRLSAYLAERFPLASHGLLIAAYYSSNQFLARTLTEPGRPMHYDWTTLLGAVTLLCFFFHLRVFDEHKDYAEDLVHYPHRVLQSGAVTLRHLKMLGGLAIATEIVLSALRGPAAFVAWLAAFLFSVLMLKEFFVPRWLKRHFLVYAVSHLLVMPLLALMVFSFATGRWPWEAPFWFGVYAWVGFFVTFNWEVSRKIRAPEDEIAVLRARPYIPGLTMFLKALKVGAWNEAVTTLQDVGLLAPATDQDDRLDAHPLVREHFAEQLKRDQPEAWREGRPWGW